MKSPFVCRLLVATCLLSLTSIAARAQEPSVFDAKGFQQNRAYVSYFDFEHVDPFSGNVILTFTDFSLPGNAGMDLRWQRVHNSKLQGGWTFGIPGVPMYIEHAEERSGPFPNNEPPLPVYVTADGAAHTTFYPADGHAADVVVSKEFWRYDRRTDALSLPNGWTAHYDLHDTTGDTPETPLGVNTRYLTRLEDLFGNALDFEYDTPAPFRLRTIMQRLQNEQNEQSRVVTLTYDDGRLASIGYGSRTWTYAYQLNGSMYDLIAVTPPIGPSWQYEYNATHDLTKVTTPNGGEIAYQFADHEFLLIQGPPDTVIYSRVVTERTVGGREVPAGTWMYTYENLPRQSTTIAGPSQTIVYNFEGGAGIGQPVEITIKDGTVVFQHEEFGWESGPEIGVSPFPVDGHLQRLASHQVTRDGRTYSTENSYSSANFGDYNRPNLIVESGELSRSTFRTFDYGFIPYVTGKLSGETVTVAGESFVKSWTYDHSTGFTLSQTIYGLPTTFTPDGFGNVATARDGNNQVTGFTYDWGVVKDTLTPEYPITRVVNSDGTTRAETQAGRTTTFVYDDLQRLREKQPPGSNAITVVYDDAGGTAVSVSRGQSGTLTRLDGFGRATATENSVGVRTTAAYDADGRKVYEGYLFAGFADIGTTIAYDALGRVRRRTNPDSTFSNYTYSAGTVTIRDENLRTTLQTLQAFGDPDETRLASLLDADNRTWTYTYNALGKLTGVIAPDGITRTWEYDSRNLLLLDNQPESGITVYNAYDAAGNLRQKTDANGTVFDYEYDGNNRMTRVAAGDQVTRITYEPGSDNRQSATVIGLVSSVFDYDTAGRLKQRDDGIDGHTFTRRFDYDGNDNLTRVTYASGRRVGYEYDSENRISRVFNETSGEDYASNFAYHPSGAVAAFTSGNGIVNQIAYDPQRYWPTAIDAGELHLTYENYDGVGNVRAIGDSRAGYSQTFGYDALDRLVAATGPYGPANYDYDVHGNRQSNASGTYTYQPGTLRLATQNVSSFEYDDDGNLITAPNATYTYTPDNLLATATVASATATYRYDADAWRVMKVTEDATSFYLRGLAGQLLTEWSDPGTEQSRTRDYVYAASRLIAVTESGAGSPAVDLLTNLAVATNFDIGPAYFYDASGNVLGTISPPDSHGEGGIAIDAAANRIYLVGAMGNQEGDVGVFVYGRDGSLITFINTWGPARIAPCPRTGKGLDSDREFRHQGIRRQRKLRP